MPFRITVKNFQSIEDATLEIDGFTVVTGPNNSGKSALIRAVTGIFTNTRGFKFVRHGADFCSVMIEFPDGTNVTWEKGPKVNRYLIGDRCIDKVGQAVPDEVLALGISSLEAGGRELWPQIAAQFDGQLFLVNHPGSVLAEALADMNRVGMLNDALRFSQSDRRTLAGEVKTRQSDLIRLESNLAAYDGLENALALVQEAGQKEQAKNALALEMETVRGFQDRLGQVRDVLTSLEGVRDIDIPTRDRLRAGFDLIHGKIEVVQDLKDRLDDVGKTILDLEGVRDLSVNIQSEERTKKMSTAVTIVTTLCDRYTRAQGDVETLQGMPHPLIPKRQDFDALSETNSLLSDVHSLRFKLSQLRDVISKVEREIGSTHDEYEEILHDIQDILGEVQECPVCGTVTKHQ